MSKSNDDTAIISQISNFGSKFFSKASTLATEFAGSVVKATDKLVDAITGDADDISYHTGYSDKVDGTENLYIQLKSANKESKKPKYKAEVSNKHADNGYDSIASEVFFD
jgi:hypothetical protein